MADNGWKPRNQSIIEILPEEIDDFEAQVKLFQSGQWDETEFQAFRLKQGIYGQRQPDAQMVRVKVPFGGLSADQMDALGVVSARYAPLNKGHVTTRENVQFHHVKLADTPDFMRLIGDEGLSTREACGNTVRNVTGCPLAGVCADEPFDVTPYAAAYSRYFVRHPYTQALPRKWKTAFSGCEKDCAITAIHDMGFIPKVRGAEKGFQLLIGGGTSIMPRIADTLYEFVPVDEFLKVTEAAIRIFHRSDELRKNRMKARIKFLIDRIGIDDFRKMVEEELQEEWAQKSFDPTPLLFIEDEEKDAPVTPAGRLLPQRPLARVRPLGRDERGGPEAGGLQGRPHQAPARRPPGRAVARACGHVPQVRGRSVPHHAPAEHGLQVGARGRPPRGLAGAGSAGAEQVRRERDNRRRLLPRHGQLQAGHHFVDGPGPRDAGEHRGDGCHRPAREADAREDERLPERLRPAPRCGHRVPRRGHQGAGRPGTRLRAVPRRQLRPRRLPHRPPRQGPHTRPRGRPTPSSGSSGSTRRTATTASSSGTSS